MGRLLSRQAGGASSMLSLIEHQYCILETYNDDAASVNILASIEQGQHQRILYPSLPVIGEP